jgi:hypothetical protein
MSARPGKRTRIAAACVLAALAGCSSVPTTMTTPLAAEPAAADAEASLALDDATPSDAVAMDCQPGLVDRVKHFMGDTAREFAIEYEINDAWPSPYTEHATQAVLDPLRIQAENARVQMVSLWDYHFESGTGQLNTMGQKRLWDIVDQSDTFGQRIYVRCTQSPHETELRMVSVRDELAKLAPDVTSFDVVEARVNPSMVSGEEAKKAVGLLTAPPKAKAGSASAAAPSNSGSSSGSK